MCKGRHLYRPANDNGHITKSGSLNISQEKVTPSDDLQNQVVIEKHLSDFDDDRNVNNKEIEQSVSLRIKKNVESLKIKVGQKFNDKLLRRSTRVQYISKFSKFLPQLNVSRIEYFRGKKYYYCALCNKRFGAISTFKIHEESKCGSLKLFNCSICVKGFSTKTSLKTHINIAHNFVQDPKLKCEECNIVFKHRTTLYMHNKGKHQLQIKDQSSDYNVNRTDHQEEERLLQTCEYCQKNCVSKIALQSHIRLKHKLDSESFECAHCMKQYPCKKNIRLHIRRCHMPDQIKCTLCTNLFATQENLERHLKDMHKEEAKYVCDVCGRQCKNKFLLECHLRTHTGEKPYMCQTCGKCFKTECNLIQHSVIHSESRPYGCDQCSKSFRIRNHLRQHMAVHGLNNTSVKYRKQRKER